MCVSFNLLKLCFQPSVELSHIDYELTINDDIDSRNFIVDFYTGHNKYRSNNKTEIQQTMLNV